MIKALLLALLVIILIIFAAPNAFISQPAPEALVGAHIEPMTLDEAIKFMTEARDTHRFIYTNPEMVNKNTGSVEHNAMWVERYEQSIALLEDLKAGNSINGLRYRED